MTTAADVRGWFGSIDIYLFDQIQKGRLDHARSVFDVGCGNGRNLVYFLRSGLNVFGIDRDPAAIEQVRGLATRLAPELAAENFQVADIEQNPFAGSRFDVVISSAVLHFAADEAQFNRLLLAMWQCLARSGIFFARLASTIGLEKRVQLVEGRRYRLPDGSERFLVDEPMLLAATEQLGGTLIEPLKTTNVQNQRCMTTWCLRKTGH